ncbi:MAG: hypothetical protein JSS87_02880 [Acidobacteria bacterium]|nr:hypothetical protein [Acidobacteriota bacterium]
MSTPDTNTAHYTGPRFFGAPVGDFTFFQTLSFIFAVTVASFLGGTFIGIVSLMVWSLGGHQVDYSLTYKYFGLPLGIAMCVASAGYLGTLLVRRLLRRG